MVSKLLKKAFAYLCKTSWRQNYSIFQLPLWMAKVGESEYEKISKKESFLGGEINAFLNIFLRAFFWWNIKIADITFNVDVNLNLLQSKRVYGTQSNIYDGAFWEKIVNGFSIVDVPLGSKYVSVVFVFFHYWGICRQIWRVL